MKVNTISLNARVAAISLPVGVLSIHLLNQLHFSLLPLRLIAIAVLIFGVWAFADEMGLGKPLNKAGLICFMFSAGSLLVLTLNPMGVQAQYVLIYAFALLFSILIWSAAFLHRQKTLKIIGTIGATASALPLVILISAHMSIGFGAVFGTAALFDLKPGDSALGSTPINIIEAIFLAWALVASQFLWRGHISNK